MAEVKDFKTVKVEKDDGIAWVILNRPEKRNAMNPQLHYDMLEALTELEVDKDSKVVVITGAGPSWCAGQDLREYFQGNRYQSGRKTQSQLGVSGVALAAAVYFSETDHRDGQRFLFRRRVHAADCVRFRDCRRGCDLWFERDQLGNLSGRAGEPGAGRRHVLPRCDVVHHDRRSVRWQKGAELKLDQLRGAERKLREETVKLAKKADGKESAGAQSRQGSVQVLPHHGLQASRRVHERQRALRFVSPIRRRAARRA